MLQIKDKEQERANEARQDPQDPNLLQGKAGRDRFTPSKKQRVAAGMRQSTTRGISRGAATPIRHSRKNSGKRSGAEKPRRARSRAISPRRGTLRNRFVWKINSARPRKWRPSPPWQASETGPRVLHRILQPILKESV